MDVRVGLAKPEDRDELWVLYQRTFLDAYVDEKAGITREKIIDFLKTDSSYFPKNWQNDLRHPSKHRTIYVARGAKAKSWA